MTLENKQILHVPQGEFSLQRLPKRHKELLQAFDAADEYLLDYVAETIPLPREAKVLLFNDSFGALAVSLSQWQPYAMSDSYLSQQATQINLATN